MNTLKHKILTETFESSFSIANFKKFTRELFNGPNMLPESRKTGIWREYDNHINAYFMIASYKDTDANNVLVMAVELKRGTSVERARSMQRNFISKVLDSNNYEGAIVAFYTPEEPNWRLSLVRLDYTLTVKGVELDLTPAKRFSYLVGQNEPNHTAQSQLLKIFEDDIRNPTLDEMEQAFSVEKVTKDFFNEYREKYLDLKEYLEDNEEFIKETNNLGLDVNKFAEQFSKKLMGQLAFLYFLQKKGWLGVRLLPENRIITKIEFEQIYNSVGQANKRVLSKVFRSTKDGNMIGVSGSLHDIDDHEAEILSDCFINTRHNMAWGSGDRTFIWGLFDFCNHKTKHNFFDYYLEPLFYDALNKKRKNHYFKLFNCKIPFLNGGLFEPLGEYHWKDINFEIPNSIFSNKDEKGRDADGILDIFERFNFTMNEDEPLEKEVAIDPEMLGKIFENLLDVSDRKSKGAFYTPREIVHYMCQESLINYLVNKVGVPYDDMKEFVLYGEIIKDADNRSGVGYGKKLIIKNSILDNIVQIDKALENVKVADPAVGSGAFSLGILNEIVKARNNITEYIVRINKKGAFGERYDENHIRSRRSKYIMKLKTIKNSIFAVDIEPSAVDIAKLRLWLSVVVEQEIDENNPEPHPLPNLDQNIMVGNSLIDEFEGIKLFDKTLLYKDNKSNGNKTNSDFNMQMNMLLDQSDELLDDMFKLQDRYFGEDNEERKKEIKTEIDNIRDELIIYKLKNDGNVEGLKRYKESLENKITPYFIWELEFAKIFKDNGGFDLVIGNPPYIDSEEMSKNLEQVREFCKVNYKSAKGNWDIFVIFIERGLTLLNKGGTISYIVPNKLIGAKYTEELRNILLDYCIQEIRDYSSVNVFKEADVYPIVFRIEKSSRRQIVKTTIMKDLYLDVANIFVKPNLFYRDIYWDRYITSEQRTISIIEKMLCGVPLDEIAEVKGSATVSEAYEVKEFLFEEDESATCEGCKKFINTGTIDRYISLWGIKETRYIKGSYKRPIAMKSSIQNMNSKRLLESNASKIIIGGMNKYLECYLDNGKYLAGKSTTIIYDSKVKLKYLICVLNSKLMSLFYSCYFKSLSLNGGYLRIGPPQIKMLPIIYKEEYEENFAQYYDELINSYEENDDQNIEKYEALINSMVNKIYGLNEKEIDLINS